jgi:gliding motility-associated-like protein
MLNSWITFVFLIINGVLAAQIQCPQDVVINEGNSVSYCLGDGGVLSGSSGFVSYAWTGPQNSQNISITPTTSGQYILNATDGTGCISSDTIDVTIFPNPGDVILSSEGNTICPTTAGTILSMQDPYTSYLWSDSSTAPSFFVNSTGTYSVEVIDANGCVGNSSIVISAYNFQLKQSLNNFCSGGTVALQASGGSQYLWSTGETGAVIVVDPSEPTTYSVTISVGTCSETLSTVVLPSEEIEADLPDTIYIVLDEDATIAAPTGFSSYTWSPQENVNNHTASTVTYTSNESGYLSLEADYQGLCTYTDSAYIFVLNPLIPQGFSPNNDGLNDYFIIDLLDQIQGSLKVWNRWGDLVFEESDYQNNWKGKCSTPLCLGTGVVDEGTYFYELTIRGYKFNGYVVIKR